MFQDDIRFRALSWDAQISAGIVPMDYESAKRPVSARFVDLSPEDARRLKRKFRKLWRKRKKRDRRPFKGDPTPANMKLRRQYVLRSFNRLVFDEINGKQHA